MIEVAIITLIALAVAGFFATPLAGLTASCKSVISSVATEDYGITEDSVLKDTVTISEPQNFTFGQAADQVDLIYHAKVTLAASANSEIDLQSILDAFGNSISFAKVKYLFIQHTGDAGDDSGIIVGGAASNAFSAFFGDPTDTMLLEADGEFTINAPGAGYTVDATHKELKLEHDGAGSESVIVNVLILGLSS